MSKTPPITKIGRNGISIAYWGDARYSIQNRYKDKITGDWKDSGTFFRNKLETLRDLINEMLAASPAEQRAEQETQTQTPEVLPASKGEPYDPDDIPF